MPINASLTDDDRRIDAENVAALEDLMATLPRTDHSILSPTGGATLEDMLAEPEPIVIRGQVFYQRFLSIKALSRFVRAYQSFTLNADVDDEEAFCSKVGELGSQFLYRKVGAMDLRPATAEEITEWFTPNEFIRTVQHYLEISGWALPGEVEAGASQTGASSSPA